MTFAQSNVLDHAVTLDFTDPVLRRMFVTHARFFKLTVYVPSPLAFAI